MYNSDTETLFPMRVIPSLGSLRGETWQQAIRQASSEHSGYPEQLGMVLLMVRLGGCATCNADSYRAMRGCSQCAWQTVRRFRGSDDELVAQYQQAVAEVAQFLENRGNEDLT